MENNYHAHGGVQYNIQINAEKLTDEGMLALFNSLKCIQQDCGDNRECNEPNRPSEGDTRAADAGPGAGGVPDDGSDRMLARDCHQLVVDVIRAIQAEGLIKYRYDYTWVFWAFNLTGEVHFDSPVSFLQLLTDLGLDVPNYSTLQKKNLIPAASCRMDDWTFADTNDEKERLRRIRIAKRVTILWKQLG